MSGPAYTGPLDAPLRTLAILWPPPSTRKAILYRFSPPLLMLNPAPAPCRDAAAARQL